MLRTGNFDKAEEFVALVDDMPCVDVGTLTVECHNPLIMSFISKDRRARCLLSRDAGIWSVVFTKEGILEQRRGIVALLQENSIKGRMQCL